MKASELVAKIKSGEIDITEHTNKVFDEIEKINKQKGYF